MATTTQDQQLHDAHVWRYLVSYGQAPDDDDLIKQREVIELIAMVKAESDHQAQQHAAHVEQTLQNALTPYQQREPRATLFIEPTPDSTELTEAPTVHAPMQWELVDSTPAEALDLPELLLPEADTVAPVTEPRAAVGLPDAPVVEVPASEPPQWKMRIQIEAAAHMKTLRDSGASPTVNSIVKRMAKWCREQGVMTNGGIFPSARYLQTHVLGGAHWRPPR